MTLLSPSKIWLGHKMMKMKRKIKHVVTFEYSFQFLSSINDFICLFGMCTAQHVYHLPNVYSFIVRCTRFIRSVFMFIHSFNYLSENPDPECPLVDIIIEKKNQKEEKKNSKSMWFSPVTNSYFQSHLLHQFNFCLFEFHNWKIHNLRFHDFTTSKQCNLATRLIWKCTHTHHTTPYHHHHNTWTHGISKREFPS